MKPEYFILFCVLVLSCKDKYDPSFKQPPTGFLVVEGFINTGNDSTIIHLSRTSGIDSLQIFPEKNAIIEIESDNGKAFGLKELPSGRYVNPGFPVDPAQKYRLHIRTNDQKEYESDFTPVKTSPPIDSVNWTAGGDEVTVYVTTHDSRGESIYYEWTYEDTWRYSAPYISNLVYVPPGRFITRLDGGKYISCFISAKSSDIMVTSTSKLGSDIVFQYPVARISYFSSNRLVERYSILIKQTVLTKEVYEWKQKLRKNTEELGSIFDPQPTQTGGNIHCVTAPGEKVIGMVWCSSQTEKRIFIHRGQLPDVRVTTGYEYCAADTIDNTKWFVYFSEGNSLPLDSIRIKNELFAIAGSESCVDCRLQGGTIEKPNYW